MAKKLQLYDQIQEDEYIDMDISSATLLYTSSSSSSNKSSPSSSREFEFQMSINHLSERDEADPSPADELFYEGKLLPLHLPPRLQMVEKLLQSTTTHHAKKSAETIEDEPVATAAAELNTTEELMQPQAKKSWSKKLRIIKHSSITLKLKASRAYLKSLFFTTKSGCSDEPNTVLKAETVSDGIGTTLMQSIERVEEECAQRKSFSGAINCQLITRASSPAISSCCSSSSSSSSVNSNGLCGPQTLRRSSSVNSEMESSILGAIAHCKKSQVLSSRKLQSDAASCENKESPGLSRG